MQDIGRLTVTNIKHGNGRYGPWTLVKAERDDGAVASWFSKTNDLDLGDEIEVKAAVKAHNEQYGETSLSRVRVERI